DLPLVDYVLETRTIDVVGLDVRIEYFDDDPESMYVIFHYGIVSAGRTLTVYRLLLEANLLMYAQVQAQLGIDADTGSFVLL
ncbi:molecular chaperone Tir, partial [Burkholderia pseudomallei]